MVGSSLFVALALFIGTLIGSILGMLAQGRVPKEQLSGDSRDTVKLGLTLIATLTALVLGLLVATTKGTYDSQSAAIKEIASNLSAIDRLLALYGPEAKPLREKAQAATQLLLEQMWPEPGQSARLDTIEARMAGEEFFNKLASLDSKTETQRMLKSRTMEITISVGQARQRLLAQKESSIPVPFLVILYFWLIVLFTCYGLLSPRNPTVFIIMLVCMLSVASAVFLVMELDRPFDGIIRVPSSPVKEALVRMQA